MYRRLMLFVLLMSGCPATKGPVPSASTQPKLPPELPAQQLAPPTPVVTKTPTITDSQKAEALALLHKQREAIGVPGLAAGIVGRDGLLWFGAAGSKRADGKAEITADTVFRIGSLTKIFTGMALLILRDEGKLRLDEPVARYLPEISRVRYPTSDSPRITIRHLLTHTSGLPRMGKLDYTPADAKITEASLLDGLHGLQLESAPGTKASYSNLAVGLAGVVVRRVAGVPCRDVVTSRILKPLKMTSSAWDRSAVEADKLATGYRLVGGKLVAQHHWRFGASEALGGIYSSIADMARFAALHLDAWPPRAKSTDAVIRRSSLRDSHLISGFGRPGTQSFGIAWAPVAHPKLGFSLMHAGGTYQYAAMIWLLPDAGVGAVVLANSGGAQGEKVAKVSAVPGRLLSIIRRLELSKTMTLAFSRLRQLLDKPEPADIKRFFDASFLKARPVKRVQELLGKGREMLGRCLPVPSKAPYFVQKLVGETGAVARMRCEKGSAEITIYTIAASDPTIAAFGIGR